MSQNAGAYSYAYSIDNADGITHVTFFKMCDFPELLSAIDHVAKSRPSRRLIWDFGLAASSLSGARIAALADNGRSGSTDYEKIAIVAGAGQMMGLGKRFEAYQGTATTAEVYIFRTVENAMEWLKI